ncbi:SCP2 sterol-binding domain-containing protein, partial [Kibdelosporangium lantanae]
AGDLRADYSIHIGDDCFAVHVDGGRLDVERADPVNADAVIESDLPTFQDVLTRQLDLDTAVASNRFTVRGSVDLVRRLFDAMLVPVTVQNA